ncbi:MAG: hypothetical protein JW806_04890, partial [Sedimentisphaerales bacterium]|nr:hypothetical protein [Sedimentisphaerales bacterium]
TINIEYSNADPCNLPRAFALDLSIDGTGSFTSLTNYFTEGECNATLRGYGIFPARIVIDSEGDVTDWGNPLAAEDSVGTTNQVLPSSHIVLELASLYMDSNAPATSGVLCTLGVDCGSATAITMVDEDVYRGGVVLEDGTQVDVSVVDEDTCGACLTLGKVFSVACNPTVNLTVTQAMLDKWEYLSRPNCWCCDAQKCGNGAYGGSSINRVDTVDLGALKASWFKAHTVVGYNPCVDFNLSGRVDTVDLGILKSHWFRTVAGGDCL